MERNFILEAENLRVDLGNGISRQILGYDNNIMMVKIDLKKNSVGAIHNHFHSQTSYVLKGVFEVTINGETKTLKEGDGFFVPSGLDHGVLCISEGSLIDTFSPVRKDFLPDKSQKAK